MIAEIARFARFARKVLIRVIISRMKYYKQVLAIESLHSESEKHSSKVVELVRRFVAELEEIPDGCAELFPFELIDELRREYL